MISLFDAGAPWGVPVPYYELRVESLESLCVSVVHFHNIILSLYFLEPQPVSNIFNYIHAWMWELDHKEGRVLNNWCFQTMVLEKTLEITLNSKEIKPVNPEGSQSWIFVGRSDAEDEAAILWSPDVKSWLIGKEPDAGKDLRQRRREWQRRRWLNAITDSVDMSLSKLQEMWRTGKPGML